MVILISPPHSCILYMHPHYGFQWSNISHLLSLLKMYAFEQFWYVFWIFQMQDILWIFDIRIWMIFIFTAMTKICDLLSFADCIDGEKWATFFSLYNTAIVLCCIPPTQCKVLLLLYYYYYRWVECLETKCRFLMETDSLESIEFLC